MKSVKSLQLISVALSFVLIFQSCGATYQGSYTIQEAFEMKRGVRITTREYRTIEYAKIDTLDGHWVGEKRMEQNIIYEPIDPKSVIKIELKKSKASEVKEGQMVVGIIVGIVLIGVLIVTGLKSMPVF